MLRGWGLRFFFDFGKTNKAILSLWLGRSLSTATHFSLQKVNFESASKVVPNDCNDMFWCISITNNVKSCKKFSEKAQTGKITVFTMVNQHCGAENMEK